MMLLCLVLAAAPQLAAPGLTANGVAAEQADALNEYFAQQLSVRGVRVVTRGEIGALIGLERQKQLLGCDESSCITELSGALGVAGLITGSVAMIGTEWVVNVKIIAANGAREVAAYSARKPDEAAVLDFLADSAADLAGQLGVKPPRRGWIIAAALAGAFAVSGALLMGLAKLDETTIREGKVSTYAEVVSVRGRGETLQFTGVALLAAAGAAGIASAILFGFTRTDARASVVLVPGGAGVTVTFTLP